MSAPSRSRGAALFAAIAILVVLAGLGAFVVSVTGLRDQGQALDVLGTRALHAARAGVEWYLYRIQNPEDTSGTRFDCTGAAAQDVTLTSTPTNFTVTVLCTTVKATESGADVWVHSIVATACNIPNGTSCPNNATTSPAYVERKITALTETCRVGTAVCTP